MITSFRKLKRCQSFCDWEAHGADEENEALRASRRLSSWSNYVICIEVASIEIDLLSKNLLHETSLKHHFWFYAGVDAAYVYPTMPMGNMVLPAPATKRK